MKAGNMTFLLVLSLFLGCANNAGEVGIEIDMLIENLHTVEEKRLFLEKIMEEDQKVRGPKGQEIMLTYGKDSKEHWDYTLAQWAQDSINLIKTDRYLEKYGHPKIDELGEKAAIAPWAVIHHQTDVEIRNKYFEILYQAYLEEDIDDSAFTMYLGRTYEMTFRERLEMKSPFTVEDEIKQLINKLGFEERKMKVLKLPSDS